MSVCNQKLKIWILFVFLLLPSAGEALTNFHEVEKDFFRGGQPNEEEIKALRLLGIQTIVSFRNEKELIWWERKLVEKNGMAFVSIPLIGSKSPTLDEARYFLEIASDPGRRPLYIHCREGKDRTGAMVALYRIATQSYPVEEAYAEARRFGFRDTPPLRRFILKDSKVFRETPERTSLPLPMAIELIFYVFEIFAFLFGLAVGVVCLRRPDLAIEIQRKFYKRINWDMTPISMKKELRNTRMLGGGLLIISFVLVVFLYLFSI